MKIFNARLSAVFVLMMFFASAGVQAQTLAPGARVQDGAQCVNIKNKNNVDDCQRCVVGKGTWVTGKGCEAVVAPKAVTPTAAAPNATTLAPGARVQDGAQCVNIKNKDNVDDCQRCVAGKGAWVTGQGCQAALAPKAATPAIAAPTAAAPNAATLAPGTRVQDGAQCVNIKNKDNVDDCQRCVAGKGAWVTGKGCVAR